MAKPFENKIKIDTPSANVFNLQFRNRFTHYMGVLYPVLHKEIVPGDRFKVSIDSLTRLAPMTNPVFDEVDIHYRAFFVPNRIIDPKWKQFITAGEGLYNTQDSEILPLRFNLNALENYKPSTPPDETSYLTPNLWNPWLFGTGSLADMLNIHFAHYEPAPAHYLKSAEGEPIMYPGAPITAFITDAGDLIFGTYGSFTYGDNSQTLVSLAMSDNFLSLLPFLGYHKVFDDWYRNERVQAPVTDSMYSFLGDERTLPVESSSTYRSFFELHNVNYGKDRFTTALPEPIIGGPIEAINISGEYPLLSEAPFTAETINSLEENNHVYSDPSGYRLFTRIAETAATTVQQLKFAFKAYSFFMKDTYNGNRYVEFIESHFDKRVPDSTLDRAIYLGSHKETVSFGEVFQTSAGDGETSALGDYAGRGVSAGNGFLFDEEFLEHGQLYVMCSIVPRATYSQGIDRKFFKNDRFDYFFPEFQNIGDVEINTMELFYNASDTNSSTFGYNSRWCELKESLDEVHGEFLTSQRSWLFDRKFATAPVISEKFSSVPQINNPFTVLSDWAENYMFDVRFNIEARRPLYYYEEF